MEMNLRKMYYTEKLFTVSLNVKSTLLSSILLRDNVKDRKKVRRKILNADFLRERQKLRETFGEVICVSQYACSLKIKKQKNESVGNLATKGIQLNSL